MRLFLFLGGVLGFLAVALGAFGAHALKDQLSPQLLATFDTGARYHLIHAGALVLVGLLIDRHAHRALSVAGWAFLVGVLLFSGSLYSLAITGVRWLGAITPFGGVALLLGWASVAAYALVGKGTTS